MIGKLASAALVIPVTRFCGDVVMAIGPVDVAPVGGTRSMVRVTPVGMGLLIAPVILLTTLLFVVIA